MKRLYLVWVFLLFSLASSYANEPDSAYVFSYSTTKNGGHNGLHYAWSVDQNNWHEIGSEFRFLFSDYGNWGEQKRMLSPFLFQDQQGGWHCIWSLNEKVGQFAHAFTKDLYTWDSQSYPTVMTMGNVLEPEVSYQPESDHYLITWLSDQDDVQKIYKTSTTDFRHYTATEEAQKSDRINKRIKVLIDGESQTGVVNKVPWSTIDALEKWYEWNQYQEMERSETLRNDSARYADVNSLEAEITINPSESKAISDMLIGVFFEDINYSADGGLYAELVQNRGFEYDLADRKYRDENWNSRKAWEFSGNDNNFKIDSVNPVHKNQKHYAVLEITKEGQSLTNKGFDGIPVKAGDRYIFSCFVRRIDETKGKLTIRLVDKSGKIYAEKTTKSISSEWDKQELVLTAKENADHLRLEIIPQFTGKVALDLVSLFPQKTFKARKNGLRADLAQAVANLHPRFVRFPGGCVAHGDGLHNIYRWKNTVGPLETRKPDRNIWNYHQSMGLGYFEYFQFCEDIGAEPLPVLAAGVPCQNSSCGGYGQQGGIPMSEMDEYVQDILDLIEWANGDKNSQWGKVRAEAGHPEPFNLQYIGIGNEDLITDIFAERFAMIYKAIREQYPKITVIGTVGPSYTGTDYRVGWDLATQLEVPMVDEHYYQSPGWFINNQDFYDRYDRSEPKVYLGEYATHIPGRRMNIETALCEALHLSNIERNGDVVSMTSFAPLLAKEGHTQWNPDMIYFNNTEVKPTVDYYVQKLYGQNLGDKYIPSFIKLSDDRKDVKKRVASSLVYDSHSGDYILKLTNLLPVSVNTKIDLSKIPVLTGDAELTVISGEVDDEKAKPKTSAVQTGKKLDYILPAYSFSVIRMKSH